MFIQLPFFCPPVHTLLARHAYHVDMQRVGDVKGTYGGLGKAVEA